MTVPFVYGSYSLRSRTADLQRTVGMIPMPLEPANERSLWVFKDVPGLVQAYSFGAPIRGVYNVNGRAFVVAGASLYEIFGDGRTAVRGGLGSPTGYVGFAANTTQLVVSDGAQLYTMPFATNVVTGQAFPGKARIDYIDQYIVYITRDSQQFGWTGIGDATKLDALDFASAEASPDNLVSLIVDHRELLLFGTDSTEDWGNTTGSEIFARNQGVAIEYGVASEWSVAKLDSSVFWLASSSRGQGSVVKLTGYVPVTISTAAIEQKLSGLDLSGATAFAFEWERSKFYCLNVPGLDTTLVFDALTNQWHEWAELVNGERVPHRATHHLFAFNNHYVGDATGKLYRLDPTVNNNAGDPKLRERITPVSATPMRDRIHYQRFVIDCERGTGGKVSMRYSPDGGRKWTNWKPRSLGAQGVFRKPVQWRHLNAGRDMVIHVRCTDDVPFNPVSAGVE